MDAWDLSRAVATGGAVIQEPQPINLSTQGEVVTRKMQGLLSASDRQVGGNHYKQLKVEPWDVVEANNLDFFTGNALKYILRHNEKGNPVQDLNKAIHYLQKRIEILENSVKLQDK